MVRRNNNGKVLTLEDLDGGAKSVAWDPKGEFLAAAGAHRLYGNILYGNIYQNKLLLRGEGGGGVPWHKKECVHVPWPFVCEVLLIPQ